MDNNENFNDIPDQLQDEPIDSFDDVYNDEFNVDDLYSSDDLYSNNNINYDDGSFNAPQQNSSDIPKRNNSYSLNKKSSSSDDGTYKAKNRKEELEKEKSKDSNKKATKVATQAAATAFAGPAGGKIASVVNNTEIGNKIHDKLATKMEEASHRNPMARKMQKSLNKLNDAGALDAAQTGVDMMGNPEGAAQNAAAKGASDVQNVAKAADKANGIKSKASSLKNKFTGNGIFDNKKSSINTSEDEKKKIIKQKLFSLIKKHPWILGVFATMFIIIIILLLMGGAAGADDVETNDSDINYNYSSACSEFPMKTTSLTKDEFRELLENNLVPTSDAIKERDGIEVFIENADTIYEIATENNINPELVVVRAALEGFTPGFEGGVQTNNYWGLGVGNGTHDGIHYESFDVGVLEFVRNVSQYSTVAHMMSKYAYIGDYWANAGDNSLGGCTYVTYMQPHYENKERAAEVLEICSRNSCPYEYDELGIAYVTNPSSCEPTNADDQLAYGGYQAESMVSKRQTIFKLSPEDCTNYVDGSGTVIDISNIEDERELGTIIVEKAIQKFDHWKYSNDIVIREMDGYADCASLVDKAYRQVGIGYLEHEIKGKYGTTWSEESWCSKNGVLFTITDPANLIPGDLLFTAHGAEGYPTHVGLYVGDNTTFEATGVQSNREDDIRVIKYANIRSYFVTACRPLTVYFKSKTGEND